MTSPGRRSEKAGLSVEITRLLEANLDRRAERAKRANVGGARKVKRSANPRPGFGPGFS